MQLLYLSEFNDSKVSMCVDPLLQTCFVSFPPILPRVVPEEGHVLLQVVYRAVINPAGFLFQGILDFMCFPSLAFFVSKYTVLSSRSKLSVFIKSE